MSLTYLQNAVLASPWYFTIHQQKNKEKHILYLSCTDSNDIWNLGQVSFHFNCQQQNPITFLI